jgi:hypothetical protein
MAGPFFLAYRQGQAPGEKGPNLIQSPKCPRENLVKGKAKAGKMEVNFQALAKVVIPQGRETEENLIKRSDSSQPSQTAVNKKTRTEQS